MSRECPGVSLLIHAVKTQQSPLHSGTFHRNSPWPLEFFNVIQQPLSAVFQKIISRPALQGPTALVVDELRPKVWQWDPAAHSWLARYPAPLWRFRSHRTLKRYTSKSNETMSIPHALDSFDLLDPDVCQKWCEMLWTWSEKPCQWVGIFWGADQVTRVWETSRI